ncbi:MAG TPA: TetR/AcrR family transcriptional regulator [Gammaproteobacteria bacterium]|jgi:AcrR family transcriptional regulator|nr:TetR/AcrR family transcriptional regulator [Gammaproteobacteria bacterium]
MARPERRQREFLRREEEILDAALSLCACSDFESVRVDQIAERSDVGKGTVYKHFSSKDDLLFRLYMRFYRGLLEEMRARAGDRAGDPIEQLRFIFHHAFDYHVKYRDYRYVIEYVERNDFKERAEASWREDFLSLDRAFLEWGGPIIEAGMQRGDFPERRLEDVLTGVRACFSGALRMLWATDDWCVSCELDSDKIVASATEFMIMGITGGLRTGV